jgi:hypothetical protein
VPKNVNAKIDTVKANDKLPAETMVNMRGEEDELLPGVRIDPLIVKTRRNPVYCILFW